MNHLNPVKTGLALGKLVGGIHLIWAILIALGWAQALVDFSLWAHMVSSPVTVEAFDFSAAATLVVAAAAVGYAIGYAFAKLWNWLHR